MSKKLQGSSERRKVRKWGFAWYPEQVEVIKKMLKKLNVDMSEFMRRLIPRSDPADILEEAVEALGGIDRLAEVLAVIYHVSPAMYEYLMGEIKERLASGKLNWFGEREVESIGGYEGGQERVRKGKEDSESP